MLYKGVCREEGKKIPEKFALVYALSRCLSNPAELVDFAVFIGYMYGEDCSLGCAINEIMSDSEEAEGFVEWYYFGNWYEEEEEL